MRHGTNVSVTVKSFNLHDDCTFPSTSGTCL